jgi:hypothetical protein
VSGVDYSSEVAMANRAIDSILAVWQGEPPPSDCLLNPEARQ